MSKFTIMPSKIFDQDLDPASIALYAFMCSQINDDGFVDATYAQMGEACGRSKAWVVENIKKLQSSKLVALEGRAKWVRILYDGQYSDLNGQPAEQIGQPAEQHLSSTIPIHTTTNPIKKERKKPNLSVPDNFTPTDENMIWASQTRPDLDLTDVTENFIIYHKAKDNKYANWQMAWRNWIKKERQNAKITSVSPHARGKANSDRGRQNIASVLERRANRTS